MSYDPTAWQTQHPIGSRATYAGLTGTGRIVVQVGKAGKAGVRVKFPAGRYAGWHTVHPNDLR